MYWNKISIALIKRTIPLPRIPLMVMGWLDHRWALIVQSGVTSRFNIIRYCINDCRNSGTPYLALMGVFGNIFQKIDRVATAPHCHLIIWRSDFFCIVVTLLSKYRIHMVPSDSFMSHLANQFGYSAGGFQALQLVVLATFGVVD